MDLRCLVVCVGAVLALAAATDVQQCPGLSIENLKDNVQLEPCKKAPCRLKKGKDQKIKITFTPETDIKALDNRVYAEIAGLPLPFIGVDGLSVCDKLETESGEKASCPLTAGTKYIYKDSFPVHQFYPSVSLKVHWALHSGKKDISCFEVNARII